MRLPAPGASGKGDCPSGAAIVLASGNGLERSPGVAGVAGTGCQGRTADLLWVSEGRLNTKCPDQTGGTKPAAGRGTVLAVPERGATAHTMHARPTHYSMSRRAHYACYSTYHRVYSAHYDVLHHTLLDVAQRTLCMLQYAHTRVY